MIKTKYQGLWRQFLVDEKSDGEMMSEEMAERKKCQARIYRINNPSIV